jgi:hypothetical protein
MTPNQLMSQLPEAEMRLVCLPRYPTVAYLFLVEMRSMYE